MDRKHEIYLIFNHNNWKLYIGQTGVGHVKRWSGHIDCARSGNSMLISRSIRKHGLGNFSMYLLHSGLTKLEADEKEIEWIKRLNTTNPKKGYNNTEGGDAGKRTQVVKDRMSHAQKGSNSFSWKEGPNKEVIYSKIFQSIGRTLDPMCGNRLYNLSLPTREICDLYNFGWSAKDIGMEYGCSGHCVRLRLRDAGSNMRGRSSSRRRFDVEDTEIVDLYNQGFGLLDIAAKYSTSSAFVSRRLEKSGVPRRKAGRRCKNG